MTLPCPAPALLRVAAAAVVVAHYCTAGAADTGPAEQVVRSTTARVLQALDRDRETISKNPGRLYRIVDEIILPHFDFHRMSQRVLGRYWHRASEEQQEKFVSEFKTLLVRTYTTALREYSDQTIEYLPSREREGGEVSVRTQVKQQGAPPIPIEYQLHKSDSGWKVFDVAIDGVSLVINYRSTFASEIRNKGLDGLIDRLVKHNAQSR